MSRISPVSRSHNPEMRCLVIVNLANLAYYTSPQNVLIILLLLAKAVGYVVSCVCLSVCVCDSYPQK